MERPIRRVEVALPLPLDRTFTYELEAHQLPAPGTRVLVPFQRGERIGWVVGRGSSGTRKLRKVLAVLESSPSVSPEILRLARWMADYYCVSLGVALRSVLPSALCDAARDYVSFHAEPETPLTPRADRLLSALRKRHGPQRVLSLRKALGMGSLWREISILESAGAIRHETVPPRDPVVRTRKVVRIVRWLASLVEREDLFTRSPRQREAYELLEAAGGNMELSHLLTQGAFSHSVVRGLLDKAVVRVDDEEVVRDPFLEIPIVSAPPIHPNEAQRASLDAIVRAWGSGDLKPFLLHGVTGSGKTLVYIELLEEVVVARGRGAIVLVPEISLTPQTVARFRARFGDRIAVLHSALSEGERYDAWRQLRVGQKRIAVGARSAVFAPVPDLGAIVVDEEHDGSYKQSESPRYHARDVAIMRAAFAGAVCVLGSATPSMESWWNSCRGKSTRLTLPDRATGTPLPPVRVLDLRKIRAAEKAPGGEFGDPGRAATVLSPRLEEAIRRRLHRREQVILLLNRRGFSSFVQCRDCGNVWICSQCAVSLTYHRVTSRLLCHHCRQAEPAPERCGRCGSRDLWFRGLGTEQVERVVASTFPEARIARMDVDTTSGKWSHHEILGRVEHGEVDILLGTQMIAKGLDFPRVTLVGVVNADVGLHLPDFRATERTFQLLSQVAGRTGRGPLGGEVLIQTSLPEHYAIQSALSHDFEGFARRELRERKSPSYPPHVRLANVLVSSPDPDLAARAAEGASAWLRRRGAEIAGNGRFGVVGPAPSPIERLHGRWRWHFLIRSRSPRVMGLLCRSLAFDFRPGPGDLRVMVDRDPAALL